MTLCRAVRLATLPIAAAAILSLTPWASQGVPASALSPTAVPTSTIAITCSGAGKAGTAYDYPHPVRNSGYTKINAHFTVRCTGPIPLIQLGSMMCTEHRHRCGSISDADAANKDIAETGGQLSCRKTTETFQAFGVYHLVFPAGYTPQSITGGAASVKRPFHMAATKCVAH